MRSWIVTVSSSPFRFGIEFALGAYRWRWVAIVRAWLYVQANPYAAAWVSEFPRARLRTGDRR